MSFPLATGEWPTHHGRGVLTTDQVRRAMLAEPDDNATRAETRDAARPADQNGN